ncbi:unnamed protein product, partial [marine sediment metagenome]
GNFDFTFYKPLTPEERKARGIEPKTTLSENLMPWRRKGEEKDKFEGYAQNFSSKTRDLPEEKRAKTGNTFTGCIRTMGKALVTGETEVEKQIK